jgi:competence protein ComEC
VFSFFSPFPFLRILILWIIGLLINPICLVVLALVILGIYPTKRVFCVIFLIGLSFLRLTQLTFHQDSVIPSHDAFVFQVAQAPVRGPNAWKIQAKVISIRQNNHWISLHLNSNLFIPTNGSHPRVGQVYQAYGILKPLQGSYLPGAFDWSQYFALQDIHSTAYIPLNRLTLIKDAKPNTPFFIGLRDQASYYLHQVLPPGVHRNVADAMFLGLGSVIDFETRQSYAALGAIHILSVSGLHVGLLFLGLQFLFGFLLRLRPWGPRMYFMLIMLVLWTYAAMSGFSAPVLRSAWMFSVLLFAKIFQLRTHPLNVWAFSGFVLLVIQPSDLFQVGFQLSYAAVLGLILFQDALVDFYKSKNWIINQIWELTCVAISAQVLVWPLIIYYFHQFPNPLYFFLLNPLLVLLSTLTLGLGFLFLISAPLIQFWPPLFDILGSFLLFSFKLLHGLMFTTTSHFQTVIPFIRLHVFELGAYYLILILLWFWWINRNILGLHLSTIIFIFVLVNRFLNPLQDEAYLALVDKRIVFIRANEMRGQLYGTASQAWIQSNASAWWAAKQVQDTLRNAWPSGSFQWTYKGDLFVYLVKPSVQNHVFVKHLILAADLDLRDPRFLQAWQSSTWYFVRKPSAYRLGKIKPYLPEKVYYLSEQPAVYFP